MLCKFLLFAFLILGAATTAASTDITLDYHYGGAHGVDFSSMPRGPLTIGKFRDARPQTDAHALGKLGTSAKPMAELVREELIAGIAAGGGTLVSQGGKLILSGRITEVKAGKSEKEIEVRIRSHVNLRTAAGAELFSGSIFGAASVDSTQGGAAAVAAALDKLVNSLLWNDYFLMQVID